jgi:hypothetical protein
MEKDSIFTGIILGILAPVIGYLVIEQLFNVLIHFGLMDGVSGNAVGRRLRTISLLAICCNLVPFNYAKKNRFDNTMRGIVFPTILYVAFWIYKFKEVLFIL